MNIESTNVSDEKWALIVEDEELNKKYIGRFLEKNGYKYKWANNVKKAFECIEEAIKLNQSIEVIFLDIYLEPDEDKNNFTGVDFLIKRKELGLNDIGQVIVMTGNEEIHIVQECNKYDIQNYIKKPVSESNLVYEMSKIENYIKQKKCPFDGYETNKAIGRGATGEVYLVVNKSTKEKFAMKKILVGTSKESLIHNRLKSPFILEFIDSKIIDNYNYMLLEYADNGTLSDWIQNKKKIKNEKKISYQINTEQILLWITELFLGLFTTHDKNLIHRDIKTDNLFICKNDVLKIGDLGIAKAIEKSAFTVCGTHHYMAPEIHKNKEYNSKADVWAAGIVLYELVMLEKPFDGNSEEIIEQIDSFNLSKIPETIDNRIKKLFEYILNPDPKLRYSSKEILNLDFIKETMNQIDKNLLIIDDDLRTRIENIGTQDNSKEDKEKEIYKNMIYKEAYSNYNMASRIDFICPYKTSYKKSYFSSLIENCVKGSDLFITVEELSLKDIVISELIQKLIKVDLLKNVSNNDDEFDDNNMYMFNLYQDVKVDNSLYIKCLQEDHTDTTKNSLNLTKECLDIALYLWKKIQQLYNSDDIFSKKTEFVSSKEYFEFLTSITYLKKLEFDKMSKVEKLANILNIYQTMLIHYFIKMIIFSDYTFSSNDGMISKVSSIITGSKNKGFNVTYNIGGNVMNLYELKNITIRRNKKPIDAYMRLASSGDCRELLIDEKPNNTLLLVCIDPPLESVEDIGFNFIFKVFSESVYDELESFKKEWMIENTKISEEEISLPFYLKSYLVDFNNNEEDLIKFITTNIDEKIKSSTLIRNFRNKNLVLDYCK